MKPISAFIFVLSLVAVVDLSYGRKYQEDYWKKLVKNQQMPKAIADSLPQDPVATKEDHFAHDFETKSVYQPYATYTKGDAANPNIGKDHFARDFETKQVYQPYATYSKGEAVNSNGKDHFAQNFETKPAYQPYASDSKNEATNFNEKDHFARNFETKSVYQPYATYSKGQP